MTKISGLPEDTAPTSDDYVPSLDATSGSTKKVKWFNIGALLGSLFRPVGCIYIETTGTNPATTFGFGTWTLWGAGKVVVGIDSSDPDFQSAELTGGTKTVSLTGDQNGNHGHGVNDPGHAHSFNLPTYVANGGGGLNYAGNGNVWHYQDGPYGTNGSGTGISIQGSGSGAPHNNVQPYITAYMWKRTA